MSKRKYSKRRSQEDNPSYGYFALMGGFFVFYFAAELLLAARPHPTHWLAAGAGGLLAGALGYGLTLWQRARKH